MNLAQQFRIWLSRRWALVLFILIIVLFEIVSIWREAPQPYIVTRTLESSTQHVEALWLSQDLYTDIIANVSGVIYAMPFLSDSLVAIDNKNGAILWQIELPHERGGRARGLLADQNTVFVITSIEIDAYKATTGELKWATNLGYGRVSIFSQMDSGMVRVYYGDKIFEIDSETGKILTSKPKESVIWVSGNIALHTVSANQLSAFNRQTGDTLWIKTQSFYIDEIQTPQRLSEDALMVGYKSAGTSSHVKGICSLNLQSGEYNWCRPEIYISKMAIDQQSQQGCAVRDDSVIVTIDLQTGNVLGETRFSTSILPARDLPNQQPLFVSLACKNGTMVVSFGDSRQTFGLSLK